MFTWKNKINKMKKLLFFIANHCFLFEMLSFVFMGHETAPCGRWKFLNECQTRKKNKNKWDQFLRRFSKTCLNWKQFFITISRLIPQNLNFLLRINHCSKNTFEIRIFEQKLSLDDSTYINYKILCSNFVVKINCWREIFFASIF